MFFSLLAKRKWQSRIVTKIASSPGSWHIGTEFSIGTYTFGCGSCMKNSKLLFVLLLLVRLLIETFSLDDCNELCTESISSAGISTFGIFSSSNHWNTWFCKIFINNTRHFAQNNALFWKCDSFPLFICLSQRLLVVVYGNHISNLGAYVERQLPFSYLIKTNIPNFCYSANCFNLVKRGNIYSSLI